MPADPAVADDAPPVAADTPVPLRDVVIAGGGLAGLTLAIQLKRADASLDVLVLERRRHPVPIAAHKVGESSVEIGADYFANVLGLDAHLRAAQLKKFGFRFFSSEGRRDLHRVPEIGASRYLSVPSWQLDRGLFENFLAEEAQRLGVAFVDGTLVRRLELGSGGGEHRIAWTAGDAAHEVRARWFVDACGRAGMLKRKLGLAEANGHDANAVWFRIDARLDVDGWPAAHDAAAGRDGAAADAWRDRCDPPARWLSTNHMVGRGYWVWLIPLASGSHSVGIVADANTHPLETMNTFERAMAWLALHQPSVHDSVRAVVEPEPSRLQDFAFLRNFSYGCKRVFSADRWAMTGEAGLFLDPFYSPGSDFIAIANTYITDLVLRDRAGRPLGGHAGVFDQIFHSFYENTLALYENQYDLFGDARVLPVKVIWDYTYYWSVLAQFFFQRRLTDLPAFSKLRDDLQHAKLLNKAAQSLLRAWSAASTDAQRAGRAGMHDQVSLPWFAELNRSLLDRGLDDDAFVARIRGSVQLMRRLAAEIAARAADDGVRDAELDALLAAPVQGSRAVPPAPVPAPTEPMLFA